MKISPNKSSTVSLLSLSLLLPHFPSRGRPPTKYIRDQSRPFSERKRTGDCIFTSRTAIITQKQRRGSRRYISIDSTRLHVEEWMSIAASERVALTLCFFIMGAFYYLAGVPLCTSDMEMRTACQCTNIRRTREALLDQRRGTRVKGVRAW